MSEEHRDRIGEEYWEGADLVMEVVSRDAESRKRDLLQKPLEYAEAGIQEYWIVDPRKSSIMVLTLQGKMYSSTVHSFETSWLHPNCSMDSRST